MDSTRSICHFFLCCYLMFFSHRYLLVHQVLPGVSAPLYLNTHCLNDVRDVITVACPENLEAFSMITQREPEGYITSPIWQLSKVRCMATSLQLPERSTERVFVVSSCPRQAQCAAVFPHNSCGPPLLIGTHGEKNSLALFCNQ